MPFVLLLAAVSASVTWSVETTPACGPLGGRVAEEARRACAAARTCQIVPEGAPADRQVLLTCTKDDLTADAREGGQRMWSLTVAGSPVDRARQAAVWIARSDEPAEPPPPPPPAPPPPAPPPPVAPAADGAALAHAAPPPRSGIELGIGVLGVPALTEARAPRSALTLDMAAMFAIGKELTLGPAISLGRATMVVEGTSHDSDFARFAGRLGWGAPFGDRIFGATLDLGAAFTRTYYSDGDRYAVRLAFVYLSPAIVAQAPRGPVRPFAALSAMLGITGNELEFAESSRSFFVGVGLSAGAAWSAF